MKSTRVLGDHEVSFAHVSVTVTDLGRAREFYRDKLGFEEIARPEFNFPGAWFNLGGGLQLHLIVNETIQRSDHERRTFDVKYAHFALFTEEAGQLFEALRIRGLAVHEFYSSPTGMRQLFVKDPDGNMIEFIGPMRGK